MPLNGEHIPCKSTNVHPSNNNKGGDSGGDKSNALLHNNKEVRTKECDLYAQWNPRAKNTHWTPKCTWFNKDGSCKESACPYGGAGGDGGGNPCSNNSLNKDLKT